MIRYSEIKNKRKREIVLLIGKPCFWSKCTFCDYIDDNCLDEDYIVRENSKILKNVTGKYKSLECINSGSVFELPKATLEEIKNLVAEKGISKLIFEAHFAYRKRLNEIREFFEGTQVLFKVGIESFDNNFRQEVLNKNADFKSYKEVEKYFDSPCIMVGIKGQTKEMIDRDIEIIENHFKWATVNVFVENTTDIKRDNELVSWFMNKYVYLKDDDRIDFLYENTDFGVGGAD
ncbi:radical SAM protein [Peptoniphilus catoniae]|uniref:radical SAM protein n=1 Tax=Peptoniphilus catoniae TaxID=1660341 RepID=UPI0010FF080F|nr:radical SAM protein [Peptoniphilus catoniae]